jgi:hypothetical protein
MKPINVYWLLCVVTGIGGLALGIALGLPQVAVPAGVTAAYSFLRLARLGERVGIRWTADESIVRQVLRRRRTGDPRDLSDQRVPAALGDDGADRD